MNKILFYYNSVLTAPVLIGHSEWVDTDDNIDLTEQDQGLVLDCCDCHL